MRMGVGWKEKLAESSISVTTQPPFCQLCLHHNATTVHCNGHRKIWQRTICHCSANFATTLCCNVLVLEHCSEPDEEL